MTSRAGGESGHLDPRPASPSRRELLAGGVVAAGGAVLLDRTIRENLAARPPIPTPGSGSAGNSVLISSDSHPGIDPTGRRECGRALTEALSSVPPGWEAVIAPGSYLLSSPITADTESFRLSGYGVTLIQTGASPVISVKAGWPTPLTVTSFGTTARSDGAAGPTSKIVVDGSVSWAPGTLIKVFSNDSIPGSRTPSDGRSSRMGEYAIVASSGGSEITTTAPLRGKYSDNARVVETSRRTAQIRGFTLEGRSPSAKVVGASMMYLAGLLAPLVEDIRCVSAHGPVVHLKSCYAFNVARLDVSFAEDDAPHRLGYGVLDNCSEFGTVQDSTVRHARHAYTDDTPAIPRNSTNPHGYGSSYGNTIVDCNAVAPSRAGFDTHHASEATTFSGCTASAGGDDVAAFSLRGRNHRVIGCSAQNIGMGVRAFTEAKRGGQSFGHVVQAFTARSIRGAAVAADIHPTGHPNAGELEMRPVLTVTGVTVDGARNGVRARNATIVMTGATILVSGDKEGSSFVQNEASDVQIENCVLRADVSAKWSPVASTTGTDRNAQIVLRNVSVTMSASALAQAETIFTGSPPTVGLQAVSFSGLPRSGLGAVDDRSALQWETQPASPTTPVESSAAYSFRGDLSAQMPQLWRATDPHLLVELQSDNRAPMSVVMGRPRRNSQLVTLMCSAESGVLRLSDDASARLVLTDESERILQPGRSVTLAWTTGGWVRAS